ncbi:helix-turn-helix domain-containing protein [Nocardioides bruguierae]|uniref:helix-turn-helix domain-containing protein n=1 Tax=Nocardioides bruguierae TaxID=2945102 RepID=UPI0020212BCB|nr:helix-turn-helix domain-containing protein [Nocardioides bruguierae]MCL8027308.1 helix-turn-helix domain-containing protein [Nocardioides bruguierae]
MLPAHGDPIALRLGAATRVAGLHSRHRDLVDALSELAEGRCDVAEIDGYEYVDADEWAAGQASHQPTRPVQQPEPSEPGGAQDQEQARTQPADAVVAAVPVVVAETAAARRADEPVPAEPVDQDTEQDVEHDDVHDDVQHDELAPEPQDVDDEPTPVVDAPVEHEPAAAAETLEASPVEPSSDEATTRGWDPLSDPFPHDEPRASADAGLPRSRNPFTDAVHRMSGLLPSLSLFRREGQDAGATETGDLPSATPEATRPVVAGVRADGPRTGAQVGSDGGSPLTVFGANALRLDPADTEDGDGARRLPEARELRRPGSVDLVEETTTWGDRVRPIARAGHPVDPIAWADSDEPADEPVVGPELAAARTRLGLSVDQLADRTRVRPHVIEAMEVDDFGPCGGDFYARGHLRTLARVLGTDPAPLVALYDEHYADAPVSAQRVLGVDPAVRHPRLGRGGSPRWSVLVAAVMALVLAWSIARLVVDGGSPAVEDVPTLSTSSAAGTGARTTVELTAAGGGARVVVRDGANELVFRGTLAFGEVETLDRVSQPVRIRTSDGSLEVSVGGVAQGAMGRTGHAAEDTYTAD